MTEPDAAALRRLLDRQAVVDTVVAYASGIDLHDWDLYRDVFTDPCWFDFSSWSGRPAGSMPADAWVHAVRSVNGNFDATQHISTNHVVTFHGDDHATCRSYMHAQHYFRPETMAGFGREGAVNTCTLGGYYTNDLVRHPDRWRIERCRLTVTWQTGDPTIFELARTRHTS
jgi:hypothetical protein